MKDVRQKDGRTDGQREDFQCDIYRARCPINEREKTGWTIAHKMNDFLCKDEKREKRKKEPDAYEEKKSHL